MDTVNEVQKAKQSEMREAQLRLALDQLKESKKLVTELQARRRRSQAFSTFLAALVAAVSFTTAAFLLASVMLSIGVFP